MPSCCSRPALKALVVAFSTIAAALWANEPGVGIKEQLFAWDPAVQARVVEEMADGEPRPSLEPPPKRRHVQPRYPQSARKARVEGVVTLDARVGVNGRIEEFAAVTGNDELVAATKEAVSKWRFQPLRIDGTPHELRAHLEATFSLR